MSKSAHAKHSQAPSEKLFLLRLPKLDGADHAVQSLVGAGHAGERRGGDVSVGGKSATKGGGGGGIGISASLQSMTHEQLLQLKSQLEGLHKEIRSFSSSVDVEVDKLSSIVRDFPSFPVYCTISDPSLAPLLKSPTKSKRLTARSQNSASAGSSSSSRSKARNRSSSMEDDDEIGGETAGTSDRYDADDYEDDPDVEEDAEDDIEEEEDDDEAEIDDDGDLDTEFSSRNRHNQNDSLRASESSKRKNRRKSKNRRDTKSSRSRGKRSNNASEGEEATEEVGDEAANAYAQQCNYWATIDPYISSISLFDLELLMPSEDEFNDPDFQFPPLGRPFSASSDRWQYENEDDNDFDSFPSLHPKCGDLTQRILSALLEEKLVIPSDLHFDLRESADVDPEIPITTSYSQKAINSLEERIREELAKIGLLDHENPNASHGEEDEISIELKSLQEQLYNVIHKSNTLKSEYLAAAIRDSQFSEMERQQRAENYAIEEIFLHKIQQINSKNKRRSRVGRPRKSD